MLRCARCGRDFEPAANAEGACRHHPGELEADLASFNAMNAVPRTPDALGIIMDGIDEDGPWWVWTCCDARGQGAPGCRRGRHRAA